MRYSFIIPIYNEERSVGQLFREIKDVMKGGVYEIVAVDDGSEDKTKRILGQWKMGLPNLVLVTLPYHQGKWAALREGIKKARGEIIITLDSDLQDDPGEFKKLKNYLDKGYDLVSGWRRERNDAYYKVFISKIGNWLVSVLSGKKFNDLNSSFKVYKRGVIATIPKEGSLLRFSLLFSTKLGFKTVEVTVKHRPRLYGRSKFGIIKYIRIIYDLILVMLLFSGSGRVSKQKGL